MELNPVSIASEFLEIAKREFYSFAVTSTSEKEALVAKELLKAFKEILTSLYFDEHDELEECSCDPVSQCSQVSVFNDNGEDVQPEIGENCTVERKIEILKLIDDHPNWSLKTIRDHGGKEFKHRNYRQRWINQIRLGGTAFEKLSFICTYTWNQFQEARKDFKCIRDTDIQIWALQASQNFIDPSFEFTASRSWVTRFKQKYHISSRKITKLVSKKQIVSMDKIKASAASFQNEIKQVASEFRPGLIFNTDQAGFEYEMVRNRTLTHKGEKSTFAFADSPTNSTKHSYTVQYVISMEGKIVGDVFVCLKEASGRISWNVEDKLFPAPNVTICCCKPGKVTTSMFEYFLDKVVVGNVHEDFVFILDSYAGHNNDGSFEKRFGGDGKPSCHRKIIPPNCTDLCQPLDTTFHRQLKYLARAMYMEAKLNYSSYTHKSDRISTRNNVIRLQSLCHNQLSSPVFEAMIRYSWFSAGLTEEKPIFKSVKEVCFNFQSADSKMCENDCSYKRFIKCSRCLKILCFPCFFYEYHYHF